MLDGYDEYTPGTSRDIDRVIESGIGNCFLTLTSRPGDYLKKEIRDQMDGEIIIEGFSDRQITDCANTYFKNKTLSTEMLTQAKRADIYELLHVPVILKITATVFRAQKSLPRSKTDLYDIIFKIIIQGCAGFPQFVQNVSERQILWSLCSVDFHTLTLQLPIQTLHSVASELHVFVSSLQNCQNFRKTSTPQRTTLKTFNKTSDKIPQLENLLDTLGEISWKALKDDQLLLKKVS